MELLTAIVEMASNMQVVPMDIREPACDPSFVVNILNSGPVQMVWGWTKSVPMLVKWIIVPVLALVVGAFLFGMIRVGRGILRWVLLVILLALLLLVVPGIISPYDLFGTC